MEDIVTPDHEALTSGYYLFPICFQQIFPEQAIIMGKNFMLSVADYFRTGHLMRETIADPAYFLSQALFYVLSMKG